MNDNVAIVLIVALIMVYLLAMAWITRMKP